MNKITLATALRFAGAAGALATTLAGVGLIQTLAATPATAATRHLAPGQIPLTLINGWTNAPFSTNVASAGAIGNIVHMRGAIATTGTNTVPFVLPAALRPATDVYVNADLCNAAKGRLYIQHNGTVSVLAETSFASAQCFTSLDGISYARNPTGFLGLPLINGWTGAGFNTSAPAAKIVNGVVVLKGSIETGGTNPAPFVLPPGYRPAAIVYAPVDMCNATKGRLIIDTAGNVLVQAETDFANAQCFTSLDGASFSIAPFKPLALKHGWNNGSYGTMVPGVKTIGGVVHFDGAMVTSGNSAQPFTLPPAFRPTADVYVPVDLCGGTNGRLYIPTSGVVSVQAESSFANAQCFTSLEGASFVK